MQPHEIERYVDAAAAILELPLDPAHRPGVLRYFELARQLADAVMGLPLEPTDEPAEAFVPIGPDDLPPAHGAATDE